MDAAQVAKPAAKLAATDRQHSVKLAEPPNRIIWVKPEMRLALRYDIVTKQGWGKPPFGRYTKLGFYQGQFAARKL